MELYRVKHENPCPEDFTTENLGEKGGLAEGKRCWSWLYLVRFHFCKEGGKAARASQKSWKAYWVWDDWGIQAVILNRQSRIWESMGGRRKSRRWSWVWYMRYIIYMVYHTYGTGHHGIWKSGAMYIERIQSPRWNGSLGEPRREGHNKERAPPYGN